MSENAVLTHTLLLFGAFILLAASDFIRLSLWNRRVTQLGIIVIAAIAFWVTTPRTPPPESVNGTYGNACCDAITLKDGVLITSRLRIPFKLRLMKYGMDAKLETGIEVRDGRVVNEPRGGSEMILFDQEHRGFTVCEANCGPGREHQFRRG